MNSMDVVNEFKMDMIVKMPFYGDIIANMDFIPSYDIETACTNGFCVMYNPGFLGKKNKGEINFIMMHEIMHILLNHPARLIGKNHRIANLAADAVVNFLCNGLENDFKNAGIEYIRPRDAVWISGVGNKTTMEDLYVQILDAQNGKSRYSYSIGDILLPEGCRVLSPTNSAKELIKKDLFDSVMMDDELRELGSMAKLDGQAKKLLESIIKSGDGESALLMKRAYSVYIKNRGTSGSVAVADTFLLNIQPKGIDWKRLLKEYLIDYISDETSYTTPERKYIHMDLILPGYGQAEEILPEVWAFIDSSGSIGSREIENFLSQLYYLLKEYECKMNVAFWDTQVNEVYKSIGTEKELKECVSRHSGGTNINCVYNYLKNNNIKPELMVILTDGYYGTPESPLVKVMKKKTILILNTMIPESENITMVGKVTRLK